MKKTAIVSGASGLVGSSLLAQLLTNQNYEKVYSLVRKPLSANKHPKIEEVVFDYDNEAAYASLPKVEEVFCCLGTTIKKAGSESAFKKVDFHYPLQLAKACLQNECGAFHVVTALGANAQSSIFYNKVKGELEEGLKKLNFEQLYIYQPSLLLGDRKEKRLGERVGTIVMGAFDFLMIGSLKKYKAIKAADVAKAMVFASLNNNKKVKTYLSDEIQALANSSKF